MFEDKDLFSGFLFSSDLGSFAKIITDNLSVLIVEYDNRRKLAAGTEDLFLEEILKNLYPQVKCEYPNLYRIAAYNSLIFIHKMYSFSGEISSSHYLIKQVLDNIVEVGNLYNQMLPQDSIALEKAKQYYLTAIKIASNKKYKDIPEIASKIEDYKVAAKDIIMRLAGNIPATTTKQALKL